MSAIVHLHARYVRQDSPDCATECGLSCDAVPVAYRDLNPQDVTCPECVARAFSWVRGCAR